LYFAQPIVSFSRSGAFGGANARAVAGAATSIIIPAKPCPALPESIHQTFRH
jgi:hypothetical protein